jgi:hypothetical protein
MKACAPSVTPARRRIEALWHARQQAIGFFCIMGGFIPVAAMGRANVVCGFRCCASTIRRGKSLSISSCRPSGNAGASRPFRETDVGALAFLVLGEGRRGHSSVARRSIDRHHHSCGADRRLPSHRQSSPAHGLSRLDAKCNDHLAQKHCAAPSPRLETRKQDACWSRAPGTIACPLRIGAQILERNETLPHAIKDIG